MTLKRLMAPWAIEKKTKKFVFSPRPGPHSSASSMPLGIIIRDVLKYARTAREVREILNSGQARVDGVVRKERGFPVGLMDVVTIGDENYRVLVGKKGLTVGKIKSAESTTKLLRIENKAHVRGKTQLNFHDGRNLFVGKDTFKTGDVVVFDIAKKEIKETLRFDKNSLALIIGGSSLGATAKIMEIIVTKSPMPNQVVVDMGDGRKIMLPRDYIFTVGKNEPAITLGE